MSSNFNEYMGRSTSGDRVHRGQLREEQGLHGPIYKREIVALANEAEARGEKYLARHPDVIVRAEEEALGLREAPLKIAENRSADRRNDVSVAPGVRKRTGPHRLVSS